MNSDPRITAANNLTAFKVIINSSYKRTAHLDYLDLALMEVVRYLETGEGIKNLIIEMPPRSGKSLSVSQIAPAWIFGRRPDTNIIIGSYSSSLAELHSRLVRNYIDTNVFREVFPGVKLQEDLQRAEEFGIIDTSGRTGGMVAVGIGGSVVGKGAHLILIDDPLKNRAEAESETLRNRAWNSITNDFMSRFNDANRAAMIMMMQRYHTDDPIGRILNSSESKNWKRLSLPALAEENDLLGRSQGDPLWSDRFNREHLLSLQRTMGTYAFAAQYQQRPIPRGEATFNTDKVTIFDTEPVYTSTVVRFYDLASTKNNRSDYTVGLKLVIAPGEIPVVLDIFRARLTPTQLNGVIKENARKDGKSVHIVLEGEKAGIIHLDFLLNDPELRGYTVTKQPIKGDKPTRATAIATRNEHNKFGIVRAHWNAAFLDEMSVFPVGGHDDQIDALSGAYQYLSSAVLPKIKAVAVGGVTGVV